MLGYVIDMFVEAIIKFLSKLPVIGFDYNTYLTAVNGVLGILNWFIPFYLFRTIIIAWEVILFGALVILLVYRWVTGQFFKR